MDRGAGGHSPWGSRRVGHSLATKQQRQHKHIPSQIVKIKREANTEIADSKKTIC